MKLTLFAVCYLEDAATRDNVTGRREQSGGAGD